VKRISGWLAASVAATALLSAGCVHAPDGIEPVRGFDVERYMGRWYEVARLDHRFERGLDQVTATYTLQPDGTVRVVNRGFDAAKNEWNEAVGKAKFVGPKDVGALKVAFFGPFYGGYNVVDIDPDYQNVMIVGPSRSYLWILSRVPDPPADVVERLKRKATDLGFDTSALVYPKH
jgi:apolipoprotein D and lipocalin family protein